MKATLSILLILAMTNIPAWATLGQNEASVTTDQQITKSEEKIQTFQNYRVHQLTTTTGPVVREYVSPGGMVFGVAWQGRSMPDVKQLLGTYVANFQAATPAQTQVQRRRGVTIKTDSFVYSNFCHMRFCTGSAYVPSLVPNSVSAEVVR